MGISVASRGIPLLVFAVAVSALGGSMALFADRSSAIPKPPALPTPASKPAPKPIPPKPVAKPAPVLRPIPFTKAPLSVGLDRQLFGSREQPGDREALLSAIDYSLRYIKTPKASAIYQQYSTPEITRERVQRSLERLRELVQTAPSAEELQRSIQREFVLYQTIGQDGRGTVAFTGYFEPVYAASRVPTPEYRYPLYRLPPDLAKWPQPHPTRLDLEGADGLQANKGRLKGLELVWLRDRFEAFLVQVQGSARLQLPDGSVMTVGYAGRTEHAYTGVGRQLVKDGKFRLEELTLPKLVQYFQQHPADMDRYLPRNKSFVFFRETNGARATGSLGVPVTAERSIATDKTIMPPGAPALILTQIPYPDRTLPGKQRQLTVSRFVLDQDTGGAIIGPGRVDIFMGTGPTAGDRAGLINARGQLYYLLLRDWTGNRE